MNLYVTKIDDVVRDRSWSLDLTFFGCFFFVLFREKGNRRFFEQPCLEAETIDPTEVNINTKLVACDG